MTRAEFAKVITKLLGLKEITGTLSYNDKNYTAKNWAVPYIEAVTAAGIMEGKNVEKKIFDFNGKVTVAEMATILTRALDLEIPTETNNNAAAWAKGYVQAAINAGLIDANANFSGNASRELLVGAAYSIDQAQSLKVESYTVTEAGKVVEFKISDGETVKVTLDKALEANKETEVKFTYKDKEFTEKVTYVVTTATKVESVTASNLKEVTVNFDGKVDEDTATDKVNYSLKSGKVIKSVALSADAKTATLYLEGSLTNNKTEAVTVSNVKAGDKTVSASNVEFNVSDNQLPEVESVKSLGTKSVKVVFSEPVTDLRQSNFNLDGKEYFGKVDVGANNRSVILTPYSTSSLAVGDHKLTISGVKDFAAFVSLSKTVDFTVVEDTTAPTVASAEATLESVTLTFSEDVDVSTISASNVYWKSGNDKKAASSYEALADNKYKFYFGTQDKSLPTGSVVVYVDAVKDYSGNQIASGTTVVVSPSIDQTRPEVTKVTSTDEKTIKVTFNKAVTSASAVVTSNYTVTDKDGKVISVQSAKLDPADSSNKTVLVSLYTNLSAGNNNIVIKNIKDATKLENTMLDYSGAVSVGDTTPPTIDSEVVSQSDRRVVITFSEKMDPASLADYNNYLVEVEGTTRVLTSNIADITVLQDGSAVAIKFAETFNGKTVAFSNASVKTLTILAVKDAAGNPLKEFTTSTGNQVDLVAGVTKTLGFAAYKTDATKNAELVDARTVKVKLNAGITDAYTGAFSYEVAGVEQVASVETNSTSVVTVKFNNDLKTDAAGLDLKIDPTRLVTTAGSAAVGPELTVNTTNLIDSLAPNLVTADSYVVDNVAKTITLAYSEDLVDAGGNLNAADFKVIRVFDYKTLDARTEYSVAVVDNTVVITLTDAAGRTVDSNYRVEVKGAQYVKDAGGNAVPDTAGETTVKVTP
ncbi:hypothetical protein P9222_08870 [Paenibacillus amylolyticus]|nr:hypothetical protein [Paenibacillus amylolyticus]WFR64264.1 hypothetical protein P9222_08870 [Paenibacillus amylolyticus]